MEIPDRLWDAVYRMAVPKSYCIKCRKQIPDQGTNSLCCDCWEHLHKTTDFRSSGKYCHICGKETNGITVARPMCKPCYDHIDSLMFDKGIDRMLYR